MAKKNNKIMWIIGIIIVLSFFISSKDKKQGFGCQLTPSSDYSPTYPSEKQGIINMYLMDEPYLCTMQFEPVCADGITYPNACVAKMMGHENYVDGQCTSNDEIPCSNLGGYCSESVCNEGYYRYVMITSSMVPSINLCPANQICCIKEKDILPKIPVIIRTSIIKIELYGPDGWVIVYDGNINVELKKDNIQQIVSEKIMAGNYTKIRITWGGSIKIIYSDGTEKIIEFKERVWEFNIDFEVMTAKTRNVLIDIPMTQSFNYDSGKILFNPSHKIEHNFEEGLILYKYRIGNTINIQSNPSLKELRDRIMQIE